MSPSCFAHTTTLQPPFRPISPRRSRCWNRRIRNPPNAPPNTAGQNAVCGSVGPMGQTCYSQTEGFVYDSEPRVISNLIVDVVYSFLDPRVRLS